MEPGDDAAALEASMLENLARLDPDEMTQYETFVRLNKTGKSVADGHRGDLRNHRTDGQAPPRLGRPFAEVMLQS